MISIVLKCCLAFVELDPAITGQKDRRKTPLNSGDLLFNRLRDMNFAAVGQLLNQTAKKLDAGYQERHQAKTVSQLKEFVGKLGSLQQEHQSLRLRMSHHLFSSFITFMVFADTNLADFLSKQAFSEEFHKNLQIEQGSHKFATGMKHCLNIFRFTERSYPDRNSGAYRVSNCKTSPPCTSSSSTVYRLFAIQWSQTESL